MSPRRRAARWQLHTALVVGLAVCLVGFVVELRRGVDGHLFAWVYVVEWPLFAVIGTVMWWVILHDDRDTPGDPATRRSPVEVAHTDDVADDEELEAWNAYVERLRSDEREQ